MSISPAVLEKEVKRRRTFAIISHPDAGKTTLTEKLLLYGGAIHLAGHVKAKSSQRHTTSDWMEIEKQRGISISSSVLQFEYKGYQINLLDTPGHKDFSEDTYRTLTAADAAVMLIDAAKGVEPQTLKLFEVCRMRGIPIFTFMNKMDRPARDPLDLIDELEKVLGIRTCPVSWPIGMGDRFKGVYDRRTSEVLAFNKDSEANAKGRLAAVKFSGPSDPEFIKFMGDEAEHVEQELELVELAGDQYNHEQVQAGQLSPVFYGSAMNNFGVQHFLENFIEMAPCPSARKSTAGEIPATNEKFSGFIFKIQANMDPQHRDRVAFMRINSGHFTRNMEVRHARLDQKIRLSKPLNFFGQERVIVEEGWPGDIIGLLDTSGELRIGDTLCEGARFEFDAVPRFSPEYFSGITILDPMKRKQLKKGLDQLSEEGVVQVYHQEGLMDKDPVIGAVGGLQFEVLAHRLKAEYGVDVRVEKLAFTLCRWVEGKDLSFFKSRDDMKLLYDRDENPLVLFKSEWNMRWAQDNAKGVTFLTTAPLRRAN